MAKDVGCRPYIYYFPYLLCPFSQNAIDMKIKQLWTEHQLELKKQQKRKNTWGRGAGNTRTQNFKINE